MTTPDDDRPSVELLDELLAPGELTGRIERGRRALAALPREEEPLLWGSLQQALGLLCAQDPARLDDAAAAFEQAAEVFAQQGERLAWVSATANLGNVFLDRQLDRVASLQRGLGLFAAAVEELETLGSEEAQGVRAQILINVANAMRHLASSGDRAARLDQAVALLQEALSGLDPEAAPEDWVNALDSFGLAWAQRVHGDPRVNRELALEAFDMALAALPAEEVPWERARVLTNRAGTFLNQITGEPPDRLEQALADCREALGLLGSDGPVDLRVNALTNLGHLLCDRKRGRDLEDGLAAYEESLSLCNRAVLPIDWATTLLGHASALRDQQRDREARIESALREYEQVLEVFRRDELPFDWALVRMEQSATWQERLRGDRADNLEQARSCLLDALEVWTAESAPVEWANAQMNLGNVYFYRLVGDRAPNLEKALTAYDRALTVLDPARLAYDWALVQSNRAMVYRERSAGEPADNLERAVEASRLALGVFSAEAFPFERARTLTNLGAIYRDREADGRLANLEEAVATYEEALGLRRREVLPSAWANTALGLAQALAALARERRSTVEAGRARTILEEILREVEPATTPVTCRSAAHLLGEILADEELWTEALAAFRTALEAALILRRTAALRVSRHAELAESSALYRWAAYAQARAGDPRSAVVTLERGRARELSEALQRDRADLERIRAADPEVWEAYQSAAARARRTGIEERTLPLAGEDDPAAQPLLRAEALRANADLMAAIERVRRLPGFGDFLREAELVDVAAAALPDIPMVYLTAFPGSLALLALRRPAPSGAEPAVDVEPLWIAGFGAERLERLLNHQLAALSARGGAAVPFLEEILPELAELTAPLASRLRQLGCSGAVLVPCGHLGLLPLHAALLDQVEVAYAPSARVLGEARRELSRRGEGRAEGEIALLGVGDPRPDPAPLAWAAAELAGIAALFEPKLRRTALGEEATPAAVLPGLPNASYVHLACHGVANPEQPLDSHLRLAGGALSLRDLLAGPSLGASRLVTLSACQTAVAEFRRLPDEVLGLPAGFLQAGAPCVVGSLWAVDDLSTALLMERFYRLHLAGDPVTGDLPMPPARALRRAQLWLREATVGELKAARRGAVRGPLAAEVANRFIAWDPEARPFASPYFWAPFILLGEGS